MCSPQAKGRKRRQQLIIVGAQKKEHLRMVNVRNQSRTIYCTHAFRSCHERKSPQHGQDHPLHLKDTTGTIRGKRHKMYATSAPRDGPTRLQSALCGLRWRTVRISQSLAQLFLSSVKRAWQRSRRKCGLLRAPPNRPAQLPPALGWSVGTKVVREGCNTELFVGSSPQVSTDQKRI